ncbi:unnamed protein product [Citrullus colocynthis]|uniref:Uncharacterized protein n=1 Tax=Citrullus colocynthis TaxID=252529 RepID=A0ABP0YBL1_9ROSI
MEGSKEAGNLPVIATEEEMSMLYFQPFITEEEALRREIERELGNRGLVHDMAEMAIGRSILSFYDLRYMKEKFESIKQSQSMIEKNQLELAKQMDEIVDTINLIIRILEGFDDL